MKHLSDHKKGIIALVVMALVTASMGIFARSLSANFQIFQQVYFRIAVALILALIVFHTSIDFSKVAKIKPKEWSLLIFRSIATYILGVTLFTQAVISAKYSNVLFIEALPFAAVLGIIFFKEHLTKKKVFFLALAMVGVLFVALKDTSNIFSWGTGEILMVVSSLGFGLSFISRRWHSPLLNNKEITILTFLISTVLLMILSFLFGEGMPTPNWDMSLVGVLLGAGLFNVFFLYLSNYGFQKVEAILANNIIMLEVFFGLIIGFMFYSEVPTIKELIGGLLIVISVLGVNTLENAEQKKK